MRSYFVIFLFLQRISVFLLIYLLLAGLLIAISIANGVLTILKVFPLKFDPILVRCLLQGGLGVGLSHMILTLLVSIYFWIVVFSHR